MTEQNLQELKKLQPSALEEYKIFNSALRKDYDEICYMAAQICSTPFAVLSFFEESGVQNFSSFGIAEEEIPKLGCLRTAHKENRILYKEDLTSGIYIEEGGDLGKFVFFAGIPLVTAGDSPLGILYVLDVDQRQLGHQQEKALGILGNQIIKLLEYRKQANQLKNVQQKLNQKYNDLEKFASVVSHDIKSPLANIISLTEFLKEENSDSFNEETKQYLDFLIQSSYSLRNYVDGILTFYRSDNILEKEKEDVHLEHFFKSIVRLFQLNSSVEITYPTEGVLKNVNKAALTQIFLNLISNALKYNNKTIRKVDILFREEISYYHFEVRDNGNGIPQKDFEKIFDLFSTLDHNDRDGNPGSGIGLATVKKMLDYMEGSIELESTLEKGSNFKFRIKRK